MAIRKWMLLLLSTAISAVLAGCGGGSVQNPPPPPPSNLSIAFQPPPPASVSLSATAAVTAVVSNDPNNLGVDWSLVCSNSGNCGTLSPLHTDSGKAATYTPPTIISGNAQPVTVLAFATADHTKNVVGSITVTGFGNSLKGTYVFHAQGVDAYGVFQVAGVVVLDGNAAVTAGEQTHCDLLQCLSDSIAGGSYFIGPDGRGTITLNTGDPQIGQQDTNTGQQGIENFSLVMLSSSQVLIATLDNPALQSSNESSSGSMDLQTSPTAPTGGYAFSVSGTDLSTASATAWGGVLNIDSPRTISGAGSVVDQDLFGTVTNCPTPALSGTVSDPDAFGMVKFDLALDPATCFVSSPTVQFTGYMVNALHIVLVESDNNGSGIGGVNGGFAIGQGSATGTFTANKSFAGKYVFGVLGQDFSGIPSSFASAGRFAADKYGNLNGGFNDKFLVGFGMEASGAFTGTYTLDSTGSGRVDSFVTFRDPSNPGAELIFYLAGNGNPPLVLDADGDANFGPLAVGAGLAYPQAASPYSFNGRYGLNFVQNSGGTPNDGTAQITVDGTVSTLSGVVDTNLGFSANPNTPISGSFGTVSSNGHFTGGLTNTFFPTPGSSPNTIAVAFYLVDSGHGFFIETDSLSSGELSFGYFATRTPVCQGCP